MAVKRRVKRWARKLRPQYATYNRIEVSRSALLNNVDVFARLSKLEVIPVLKSNAYGHDIKLVAIALKARHFPYIAVDGYFEALRVRAVSDQPVLVMGAIRPENFAHLKYKGFAFVVHDEATIEALGRTKRRVKVHLEVNTGMNRHGIMPADLQRYLELLARYPRLELEGIMSHLADSDGDDPVTVDAAVKQFDEVVEAIQAAGFQPPLIHIAQSAGSLRAHSKYANAMRLGIGLYGTNPFPVGHNNYADLKALRPALTLISTITIVHELKKGDKVSYNYTFTAPKAMRIGVIPLGYYEGVNRKLSNTGTVKIGKSFAPIVGRVCMNHTMISLEDSTAKEGDEVIVISNTPGDPNTADNIAALPDMTNNYNILTALSPDVRRILID